MEFSCPRCQTKFFEVLHTIKLNDAGMAVEQVESHVRCSNCQQQFEIDADGHVKPIDSPSTRAASGRVIPGSLRVRSSVTADERGVLGMGQDRGILNSNVDPDVR